MYKTMITDCVRLFFATILALFSAAANSDLLGVNAGVTPYACVDGRARVLLAFDPAWGRRGWAPFGGGPKDSNEPVYETAKREFHEESNCAFAFLDLTDVPYSHSRGFYNYVAEVPYHTIEHIAARRTCQNVERSNWVWVDYERLIAALQKPDKVSSLVTLEPKRTIHLWSKSAKQLRLALQKGILPLENPCGN